MHTERERGGRRGEEGGRERERGRWREGHGVFMTHTPRAERERERSQQPGLIS